MEKPAPIKNKQEVLQTINSGIIIYGMGAFGRANLKALQEVCDNLKNKGEAVKRKITVVSERDKNQVISALRDIALARLNNEKVDLDNLFWWCDNVSDIDDLETASPDSFNIRFDIVPQKAIFIEEKIENTQDETRKKINGTLHLLACASKQSPYYKTLINEYADHEVIILDGVKGHTKEIDLNNEKVKYASMVGPNYAEEIINRAITGILIASECEETSNKIKNLLNTVSYFKTETCNNPKKLERVGIYKNIGTFAFGIAINYIQDKKKRSDLFVKILEDFTEYAKYAGLEDGNIQKNIQEMTYGFFGDMWMCMLHGISELSGKRSRNLTISREVGEVIKEKQDSQKEFIENWKKKFKKMCNVKKDQHVETMEELFTQKMFINNPEKFIELIASKHNMPTIEGFQSYKRLQEEGADLEILDFIEAALNGEDIENHSYLQLKERNGIANIPEEEFLKLKSKIRDFKEETMEANCPANTLALILSEFIREDLSTLEDTDTKRHIFGMLLDVFQERKGLVGKIPELPLFGSLLSNIPFVKDGIERKANSLQITLDEIMAKKN